MKKGEVKSNSYKAIHFWLSRNWGRPLECIKCGEKGKMNGRMWSIEWALKEEREYLRVKDNFQPLCKSCHRKQDYTDLINIKGWITRRKRYGK